MTTAPVALVTGGSRGIGRHLARRLVQAGYLVSVTGLDAQRLVSTRRHGDAHLATIADATDADAMREVVRATEHELGPLDLVVANAGQFRVGGPLAETDLDAWWREVEVNLKGPAVTLRAALRVMLERGAGRAVAVSSGMGARPVAMASAYSASKAAVLRLVDCIAGELAGTGVAIFAVSPGIVSTDMTQFPEEFLRHYPTWRGLAEREGGSPDRMADLVLTLAAGAHDALSGRFIQVTDDPTTMLDTSSDPALYTLRLRMPHEA